ncbi:MAG: UDP-4-amino-4,6-dideoxy-N-acetyl-beta-L-altrosamine transaminase [Bacteroidota bacterium]
MKLPIPYGCQEILPEDQAAVQEALAQDLITQGSFLKRFEADFSAYLNTAHSIAVANGTAALHLSAMALGWEKGQTVICSPLTFVASVNCVLYTGASVDFVDIDPETGLMNLQLLKEKLENSPTGTYQGVIPVDYAGLPIQMDEVAELARTHKLNILEDSCHAPGGFYVDRDGVKQHCGNGAYADAAIFSFHPVKHLTTGEGGMITTRNQALADKIKQLRVHGIHKSPEPPEGGWYYEMQELGYNYRLNELQAALGYSQLKRAAANLTLRKQKAHIYDEALSDLPIKLPNTAEGHAYHLYVIRTEKRKELYDYLRSQQILAQVHYIPVHYQPYYQNLGWKKGDFPHAEAFYDQCLSIPLYPHLGEDQQAYVIEKIRTFFKGS